VTQKSVWNCAKFLPEALVLTTFMMTFCPRVDRMSS
jgi:hypothetical protein